MVEDFDFRQIAPRLGGQREAFEELCCQLARRTIPGDANYMRLHGAGGDGGVECFADLPDGTRVGWQAKYVFDVDSLISQADSSLSTALKIHSTLTCYIVCFPFDLTGPTGRRGRSGQEKFEDWCKKRESEAAAEGRSLTIEAWPASKLRSLLLELDTPGGLRLFFFNETVLTQEWFSNHLESVKAGAGPRYRPELNVETDLYKWFAALGRTPIFIHQLDDNLRACRDALKKIVSDVERTKSDALSPAWPGNLRDRAYSLLRRMETFLDTCNALAQTDDSPTYSRCAQQLDEILKDLESLEPLLIEDLEAKYPDWRGRIDSPGFRQFMAEYMASFPAANLDHLQSAIKVFRVFLKWLQSPEGSLAFNRAFLLTGEAGVGKTHGVCDVALTRLQDGLLTCVVFGHRFGGEPDPWSRFLEILGLPITLGKEGFLDALNSAAEASGYPLILCIDAINETRPLQYWRNHLAEIVHAVQLRPYLRFCITCRTPYVPYCLPDGLNIPTAEYRGFEGIERYACQKFFEFYGLKPPIMPILQPELKNPLYLGFVCETLRDRGLDRLPTGWYGLVPVIRAFIGEKEKQFAVEHGTSTQANIVGGSLRAISHAIADSGNSAIRWSSARRIIAETRPQASNLPVLEWLIGHGLLIEDAPDTRDPLGEEGTVRPAFERLGDFLIADELLSKVLSNQIEQVCCPEGPLCFLVKDWETIGMNSGLLSVLSILIPEKHPGLELPYLVDDDLIRIELLKITLNSLAWRNPETFSPATASLVREGLARRDLSYETMDSVLSVAWQPSCIDAFWLDAILRTKSMAKRDAYWCGYLHERYESTGVVKRLIDAAFELPLNGMEVEIAERWSTLLLWFTAAADRRVNDWATRGIIALFVDNPEIIPSVVRRFLSCDDDAVRERVLLSCYGALILTRNTQVIEDVAKDIYQAFQHNSTGLDNALVRDHMRCIGELADELGALPEECDPGLTTQPISSEWLLEIPPDDRVEQWSKIVHFRPDEFFSDFFKYSMNCLRPWEHTVAKTDMGKWILQRIARDFGYEGSGCEDYDLYMLGKYGGGRGKPVWAERIGKKYQWIAMYQLASRLHDNVEKRRDSWEPQPLRTPLILLEERKMDPTLPLNIVGGERDADVWWIKTAVDFRSSKQLADAEWVNLEEDIPSLEALLKTCKHDGQHWRLLVSYPSWDNRKEDADWNEPYCQVWVHLESYLVPKEYIGIAYDALHRRNFFGRWMPEGATWLYGFAGEYPWATPFNTEPEEWHGRGGFVHELPVDYAPTWNQIAVEWEYDASLSGNLHMLVPARVFFAPGDLWWNGRDGYCLINGRTIFRDPSLTESGPRSLIVDVGDLITRLNRLGMGLIWTLLGEKIILGGSHSKPTPRRTFSQVARLKDDGAIEIGERVFFNDYDKDTGPSTLG